MTYRMNSPPVESEAQHKLRVVGEPLHQGVGDHQPHAGRPQEDAVPVQLEKDGQAEAQLAAQVHQGVEHADPAGGDGPVPRPLHLSVDVPVPHVVDGAAGAPHHQGAQAEQGQQLGVGEVARLTNVKITSDIKSLIIFYDSFGALIKIIADNPNERIKTVDTN